MTSTWPVRQLPVYPNPLFARFTRPRPTEEEMLQKLSVAMRSVNNNLGYRRKLFYVVKETKRVIKNRLPEASTLLTGSLAVGVDISTSDVDLCVDVPWMEAEDVLARLEEIMENTGQFKTINVVAKKMMYVLQLIHIESGVHVDLAVNSDDVKRNTQLLAWYCQVDPRVRVLIKNLKKMIATIGMPGAKEGYLNSLSLCYMLIHYLQVKKVVPNLHEVLGLDGTLEVTHDRYYKTRNIKKCLGNWRPSEWADEANVATIYWTFLQYMSEFNFDRHIISIKSGRLVTKWESPFYNQRIIVEDPFKLEPRNCAGSVRFERNTHAITVMFRNTHLVFLKLALYDFLNWMIVRFNGNPEREGYYNGRFM